jgi:hypothetical protein
MGFLPTDYRHANPSSTDTDGGDRKGRYFETKRLKDRSEEHTSELQSR